MSFIIFVLLLVSTSWCSAGVPIHQNPAQPHNDGREGAPPVGIPLHPNAPQANGPPSKDAVKPADTKIAQAQDAAANKATGNQPNPVDSKAPNAGNGVAGNPAHDTGSVDKKEEKKGPVDKKDEPAGKNNNVTPFAKDKTSTELKSHKKFNHPNATDMDSSTLKRLVLVLVAFSVLFIMYLAFRTYRRGRRRGPIIVSKYGVRTRRSDLEMRPLPLDEDDEDETVFDLGNINNR